jgi:hypothetical protein
MEIKFAESAKGTKMENRVFSSNLRRYIELMKDHLNGNIEKDFLYDMDNIWPLLTDKEKSIANEIAEIFCEE